MQRGQHKLNCLAKFVRVMVPRQQLDAVREEAAQASLEAARLRAAAERMVPRSDLFAREADNERLAAEVARLGKALESMVPRARYDALHERLEAALAFHRAEADGMRQLVAAAAAVVADPLGSAAHAQAARTREMFESREQTGGRAGASSSGGGDTVTSEGLASGES